MDPSVIRIPELTISSRTAEIRLRSKEELVPMRMFLRCSSSCPKSKIRTDSSSGL